MRKMNLLDKILLFEAERVSDEEYKAMTGHSFEESRERIMNFIRRKLKEQGMRNQMTEQLED